MRSPASAARRAISAPGGGEQIDEALEVEARLTWRAVELNEKQSPPSGVYRKVGVLADPLEGNPVHQLQRAWSQTGGPGEGDRLCCTAERLEGD